MQNQNLILGKNNHYPHKNIYSNESPFLRKNESFHKLNDEFIIGNGILLQKDEKIRWFIHWKHTFSKIYFLEEYNCILSNRNVDFKWVSKTLGFCAIDINNGEYLWHHWYSHKIIENFIYKSLKHLKSINLENLDGVSFFDDCILTKNYKVNIKTGKFSKLEKVNFSNDSAKYLAPSATTNLNRWYKYTNDIKVVDENKLVFKNIELEREGYTFKDFHIIEWKEGVFISPKSLKKDDCSLLICISKGNDVIDFVLPQMDSIIGFYNFFNESILIYYKYKASYHLSLFNPNRSDL